MRKPQEILNNSDFIYGRAVLNGWRDPDLVIAPAGEPYLYRWHVIPRNRQANVYLHIQVASDPERPLHDHPWDNTSFILAGAYDELLNPDPEHHKGALYRCRREAGDVIHRPATMAHRLILPEGVPYTMTLFCTGPVRRAWGFWFDDGWVNADRVTTLDPTTRTTMQKERTHAPKGRSVLSL